MIESKFEFVIYHKPERDTIAMSIIETEGNIRRIALPIEITMKTIEPGESVEPTFELPAFEAHKIMKSLAEALDEQGIKTDNDAKIQGTLEATRYHLEDLRKILKLDKGGER